MENLDPRSSEMGFVPFFIMFIPNPCQSRISKENLGLMAEDAHGPKYSFRYGIESIRGIGLEPVFPLTEDLSAY